MCYDRSSVGKKPKCADGVSEPGALLRHARTDRPASAALDNPSTRFSSVPRQSRRGCT
jgi:hypothetical protein